MTDRLRSLPPGQLTVFFLALVGIAALVDWATGPDLQVLLLYLVPVLGAAWFVGTRIGTAFAVLVVIVSVSIALTAPGGYAATIAVANGFLRLLLLLLGLRIVAAERRHVDQLREYADLDPLTGALNRRAFTSAIGSRLSQGTGAGTMLSIDVDGLKAINDASGHDAGDAHLVGLAEVIRASIRETDLFARLGGDEFAVFLSGQDAATAEVVASRLVATCGARPSPIRVSIGVASAASVAPGDDRLELLLRRADDAMYQAKRAGGGVRVERPPSQPS